MIIVIRMSKKYANPKTVSLVSANHQRPHTPPTMTSLMTLCNTTIVNMANKFSDRQISHAYFCFVSAFCFTCKHAETKLKQNNFTETKHCFAFVLFQFCVSFVSVVTRSLVKEAVSDSIDL